MIVHGQRISPADPDYSYFSLEITPNEWQRLQNELCGGEARLVKEGWDIQFNQIDGGLALRLNISTSQGGLVMFKRDDPIVLPM